MFILLEEDHTECTILTTSFDITIYSQLFLSQTPSGLNLVSALEVSSLRNSFIIVNNL